MNIRPAEKKDKKQIIKIASHTWGNWDYVPQLLDEWMIEGGLYVTEDNGEIIAVSKTTILSHGELWLEGIRVKEKLRGKGIGKKLAFFQLKEALKQNPQVIRLSTAEINTQSIKLIEKMGFRKVKEFDYLTLNNPQQRNSPAEIKEAENSKIVAQFVLNSVYLAESKGLLPWSWIFRDAKPEIINGLIREKKVYIRKMDNKITSLIILLPHRYKKETIEIALIESSSKERMGKLLDFAKSYAILRNYKEIVLISPCSRITDYALTSGFTFPYEFKKVPVYELVPA